MNVSAHDRLGSITAIPPTAPGHMPIGGGPCASGSSACRCMSMIGGGGPAGAGAVGVCAGAAGWLRGRRRLRARERDGRGQRDQRDERDVASSSVRASVAEARAGFICCLPDSASRTAPSPRPPATSAFEVSNCHDRAALLAAHDSNVSPARAATRLTTPVSGSARDPQAHVAEDASRQGDWRKHRRRVLAEPERGGSRRSLGRKRAALRGRTVVTAEALWRGSSRHNRRQADCRTSLRHRPPGICPTRVPGQECPRAARNSTLPARAVPGSSRTRRRRADVR